MLIYHIDELVTAELPALMPERYYADDSGWDLKANLQEPAYIYTGQRMLVPTGVYLNLPARGKFSTRVMEAQIRSRSGLAIKHGIYVLNSPGTIDNSYSGELKVILHNVGESFKLEPLAKIAQLVFQYVPYIAGSSASLRGTNGFGSSGF